MKLLQEVGASLDEILSVPFDERGESDLFKRVYDYYGMSPEYDEGFYKRFPFVLLHISKNNARSSAIDIAHAKSLGNSMKKNGIIKHLLFHQEF